MLPWINSKRSHFEKYSSIYTDKGFDVLIVRSFLMNILWPKRLDKVSEDVVSFMDKNEDYDQIVLHGLSAGCYVWSECLIRLYSHKNFESISKRIKCQVWDSLSGAAEIPAGLASSLFPDNKLMRKLMTTFGVLYLKVFYSYTDKYYNRGDKYFLEKPLTAPALIFVSKIDPIGTEKFAREVTESYKKLNIDTTLKAFDDSPHILHYQMYKEEYLKVLMDHLRKCKIVI